MKWKGIALARISKCIANVKCFNCKFETERTLNIVAEEDQNFLINSILCVNCNSPAELYCKREFIHHSNNPKCAGFGSFTWEILNVSHIDFELTCINCNKIN
jgi:hypothetical protein